MGEFFKMFKADDRNNMKGILIDQKLISPPATQRIFTVANSQI
jgi:hypothetical protein